MVDQMPMFFLMHDKYTPNEKGACTVSISMSKNDYTCITVALTIPALHQMVIFKGEAQLYYLFYQKMSLLLLIKFSYFLLQQCKKVG
jgi:hypothetical protein